MDDRVDDVGDQAGGFPRYLVAGVDRDDSGCPGVAGEDLLVAAVMVPVGVGGAFTVPPIISLILDSVPPHRAGTAGGVFNTFRQMGGSLGVAVHPPRSNRCSPSRM